MNTAKVSKKNRIWELDFLRGFAIILVLFDHTFYDFSVVFSGWENCGVSALEWLNWLGTSYLTSDVRYFWRPSFLFMFFCVSGLCTAFSRNNFLRGVRLMCVAICVSIITYFVQVITGEYTFVLFGVLHCLAFIIISYSLVAFIVRGVIKLFELAFKKSVSDNISNWILSAVCIALGAAFLAINAKYNVRFTEVFGEGKTLQTDSKILGMFFYVANWWTADYFPIFPYISFFFIGAGFTHILYPNKKSLMPWLDGRWHNVLSVAGRHSLVVYLMGQVIAIGLSALISVIALGHAF